MSGNTGDGSSEQDGVRQHYQHVHAPPYQQQQEQAGLNQQQHREDVPPTQFVSVEEHTGSSNATVTSASTANASLATAAAAAAATAAAPTSNTAPAVSHSVVPDLMRVYESMIQSKTPQNYGAGPPPPQQQASQPQPQQNEGYYQKDHQQHQQEKHPPPQELAPGFYHYNQVQQPLPPGSQQQQPPQQQQQQQQWTYDATSIPIPAPYPLPLSSEQQSQQKLPPQPPNQPQRGSSVTSTSSGRSLRKRSAPKPQQEQHPSEEGYISSASSGGGGKSRRTSKKGDKSKESEGDKSKKNDGRWSKRFTWPEDLHRDFVSAIFDVGLKQSSPATVLEQMPAHEQITTERIKSHLQKYRLHRQKSKKEFMSSYTATMQKLNAEGLKDVASLAGGQVAGHLTYAALTQPDPPIDEDQPPLAGQRSLATPPGQPALQDMIVLPRLTESEKQSPMGSSLGYLLGLFFSLKEQLDRQRQQKEVAAAEAEKRLVEEQQSRQQHVAMYDSFVSDDHPPAALPQYTAAVASAPNNMGPPTVQSSTRSNLEQSSMMKREMQSQMSFQNKLRALKQQELDKYNKLAHDMAQQQQHAPASHMQQQQQHHPVSGGGGDSKPGGDPDMVLASEMQQQEFQGTGEAGDRTRGMSIAEDDDFWNTAVVDDELFDFLMND